MFGGVDEGKIMNYNNNPSLFETNNVHTSSSIKEGAVISDSFILYYVIIIVILLNVQPHYSVFETNASTSGIDFTSTIKDKELLQLQKTLV